MSGDRYGDEPIDGLISDPNNVRDRAVSSGFAEAEMTLTDGEELKLLDSFLFVG